MNESAVSPQKDIEIEFYYGRHQTFGRLGHPQRWVNVLGNVRTERPLEALYYTLNGGDPWHLSIGQDSHRLARPGDINLDIARTRLRPGQNELFVYARDLDGREGRGELTLDYRDDGSRWPLPYSIDWQQVDKLQDVVQIVDGRWRITKAGLRTAEPYYDRMLAFGDEHWTDYEIRTSVVFHAYAKPVVGPPTYGVSHAALAARWTGHHRDGQQPHATWFPLGATSEFQLRKELTECRWRFLDGETIEEDTTQARAIELETVYDMALCVTTLPDGSSLYRVKLWQRGETEPDWQLDSRKPRGAVGSGSGLLIAHNADVTFGNVSVEPVRAKVDSR